MHKMKRPAAANKRVAEEKKTDNKHDKSDAPHEEESGAQGPKRKSSTKARTLPLLRMKRPASMMEGIMAAARVRSENEREVFQSPLILKGEKKDSPVDDDDAETEASGNKTFKKPAVQKAVQKANPSTNFESEEKHANGWVVQKFIRKPATVNEGQPYFKYFKAGVSPVYSLKKAEALGFVSN